MGQCYTRRLIKIDSTSVRTGSVITLLVDLEDFVTLWEIFYLSQRVLDRTDAVYTSMYGRDGATGVKGGECPPMVSEKRKIRRLWVLTCVGFSKISFYFTLNKDIHALRGLLLRFKH